MICGGMAGLLNVPKNQRDFEMQLSRNTLAFYDNVDERVPAWFRDGLASAATSYIIQMAQLYKTNVRAQFTAEPFIGVCTRTAHFSRGRDDLPDRSLVFHVKPVENYRDEGALYDETLENRDRILTSLLKTCNDVINNLRENADQSFTTTFRMADFARFVRFGFPKMWDRYSVIFDKMADAQSDLAAEGSLLYDVISSYLESHDFLSGTLAEIFTELKKFADANNVTLGQKSTFYKHFKTEKSNLQVWFDISEVDKNPDGLRPKIHYDMRARE